MTTNPVHFWTKTQTKNLAHQRQVQDWLSRNLPAKNSGIEKFSLDNRASISALTHCWPCTRLLMTRSCQSICITPHSPSMTRRYICPSSLLGALASTLVELEPCLPFTAFSACSSNLPSFRPSPASLESCDASGLPSSVSPSSTSSHPSPLCCQHCS